MPVHDWTRVDDGIFHFFHNQWIGAICKHLNNGLLPEGFYAIGDQVTGGMIPDVITMQAPLDATPMSAGRGTAVLDREPGSAST